MKRITILLIGLFALNCSLVQSQNVYIYDESGNKLYFNKTESVKFISINSSANKEKIELIRQHLKASGDNFQEQTPLLYKVTLNDDQQKAKLFSEIQKETSDLCISSMLMYADSTVQWTSNEIIVKIFSDTKIEDVLKKNSIPYKNTRQLRSDLQTFIVTLTGVEDKTIEYANLLYESGNVVFAQPSFWRLIKKYNSLYPQQWGFNNTGQNGGTAGIDINAPEAWQLSTGVNIKVAVIDEGVDLTHTDLDNNLLSGYDATDGKLGGSSGSYKGNDAHGTACAGIIAAEDNNEGVKGIAYNAKIIPIRIAYSNAADNWITKDAWIADGIYDAWHNKKADVLSNSWGGGSRAAVINNQISNALTQGRNNKGCIVVFASGNSNGRVNYPANSNSDILVVGAMSPCGERKSPTSCDGENNWGSNYGTQLDVIAPGVLIPTTDISGNAGYSASNYTLYFNGTSSACPHVAGIAALILSVNPNLTAQQVRNIIESTAQKVRTDLYTYSTTSGKTNGTWNNQMGYGLVNAYAAVQAACTAINFSNITVTTNTIVTSCDDINVQNVTVQSGAKLTLDATNEVIIDGNFEVNGEFEIK